MNLTFDNIIYQLMESTGQYIIPKAPGSEKENISQAYEKYLKQRYQRIVTEQGNSGGDAQQLFTFMLESEKLRWENSKIEEIKSSLLHDENYYELQKIAAMVFDKALIRATEKTVIEDDSQYQAFLSSLNANAEKVQDFNKDYANEILSDALLDLDYAFGKSDLLSLRLSHYAK